MANSPYLDALELLREVQDELKRLVQEGNAPADICLLSERVDQGMERVDNSRSNPRGGASGTDAKRKYRWYSFNLFDKTT
jgi:hypothetical protein|tara:strand:- start:3230 stop:3469 length:240 start_codon:yes stop_codon:yes gene_type:complete